MARVALAAAVVMAMTCAAVLMTNCGEAQEGGKNVYAQWENGPAADDTYFPIAVWLQSPRNAPKYAAAGINLYIGLWKGPTEEQLAELKRHGMRVICEQNEVGLAHLDDPMIAGWMHGDEPDNAQPVKDAQGKDTWGPCIPPQRIVDDYERIRAKDPSRPVLLNLGQGVANDKWIGRGSGAKLEDYLTYVKGGDIVSFDVYPVASLQGGEDLLWYVPKGVERLVKWSENKKIIWNCMECTHIGDANLKPTPAQVKSEVWMGLVHGSTGLIYFVHQFQPNFCEWALLQDPEMLAAVTALNKQIQSLAPVLNSPTVADGATVTPSDANMPIACMVKRRGGATHLFTVGMRNAPVTGTFKVAGLPAAAKAEVIDEGREIAVTNGEFKDEFTPYAVHLYRIK